MKKSCKYCGRIHEENYICPQKPKEKKRIRYIDQFRWSEAWKKKRKEIMIRDNYMCQVCIRAGETQPNEVLSVHHAIPLENNYDMRLDSDNLITLCSMCHSKAEAKLIDYATIKNIIDEQEAKERTTIHPTV